MIKKLLSVITGICLAFGLSANASKVSSTNKIKKIVLKESNTVSVRGAISPSSVAQIQEELLIKSRSLPDNSYIFLVLDTPGGSIHSGLQLINTAKSIPQKVVTVTNFAASMGFTIAQYLGPRLVLPHGIFMSHRARTRISGQIPGELDSRKNFLTDLIESIEVKTAKRLNLSTSEYKRVIRDEYWVFGTSSVSKNVADLEVIASCDKSLEGRTTKKYRTMFGTVEVVFSKCPLISAPLGINYSETDLWNLSKAEKKEFKHFINTMFTNKIEFVENYISKGTDLRILR